MRIGIALPTLANGDAVGHDVFGMARAIRKLGHDVEFFAWTNASEESVRMLDELPRVLRSADDVLIYHHSIGCEPAVRAVERLPCRRKVVKYHNVTPPHFFEKINPKLAEGCAEGLRQLPRLARSATAIWADSAFNARDFEALAPAGPVVELPPFHHADELFHAEPDYRAVAGLDDWNVNILLVGRVVPNKNLPLAIRAFAEFRRKYQPRARLIVAGGWPLPDHIEMLLKLIRELGQESYSVLTGGVSVGQLKALYLTADLLLVTSEHEGFCVPLIEAMGLRIPVVAVPNAAIPFTAGEAARYADPDPSVIAAEIDALLTDPVAREQQLHAGWQRYTEKFSNQSIERKFEHQFRELLEA
jgi:glycosyltransferase involved in cell wall biosynthesis